MSDENLRLPKSSNVFELNRVAQTAYLSKEWVIDWAYLGKIDLIGIKRITKLKVDYLAKVVKLEHQMKAIELQMLKELSQILES